MDQFFLLYTHAKLLASRKSTTFWNPISFSFRTFGYLKSINLFWKLLACSFRPEIYFQVRTILTRQTEYQYTLEFGIHFNCQHCKSKVWIFCFLVLTSKFLVRSRSIYFRLLDFWLDWRSIHFGYLMSAYHTFYSF